MTVNYSDDFNKLNDLVGQPGNGIISWNECTWQSLNSPVDYGLIAVRLITTIISAHTKLLQRSIWVADVSQTVAKGLLTKSACYHLHLCGLSLKGRP